MNDHDQLIIDLEIHTAWPTAAPAISADLRLLSEDFKHGVGLAAFKAAIAQLAEQRRTPPSAAELLEHARSIAAGESWEQLRQSIAALPEADRRHLQSAAVESLARELPCFAKDLRTAGTPERLILARMNELRRARAAEAVA